MIFSASTWHRLACTLLILVPAGLYSLLWRAEKRANAFSNEQDSGADGVVLAKGRWFALVSSLGGFVLQLPQPYALAIGRSLMWVSSMHHFPQDLGETRMYMYADYLVQLEKTGRTRLIGLRSLPPLSFRREVGLYWTVSNRVTCQRWYLVKSHEIL